MTKSAFSWKFIWAACFSLLTVSLHTLHALSCELLAPVTHEDMVVPRIWRCGTQVLSPVSVLIVNTALTPSESHENGF